MFQPGDRVIVSNNKHMSGLLQVGDKHIIESVFYNTVRLKGKIYNYGSYYFELDNNYYRKEKIIKIKKRICSNLTLKQKVNVYLKLVIK